MSCDPHDGQTIEAPHARPSLRPGELFLFFAGLTLIGFGGVMPFARRALVERRRLLSAQEFGEIYALSQLFPGPTICNIALMFGHRQAKTAGAAAALSGLIVPPMFVVIGLGYSFDFIAAHPIVQKALMGMAVAACALVAATVFKMMAALPRKPVPIVFAILTALGVGWFHWPLVAVVGVLFVAHVLLEIGTAAS